MTEATVEKIARNRFATILCTSFVILLLAIMGKDFYLLFHKAELTTWQKVLPGIQLAGALITVLWLAFIMMVSSVTLSGAAFKKTCPYTVTFLIILSIELIPRIWNDSGFIRWFWVLLTTVAFILVLLQMFAFNLDPHSNSVLTRLRPFRIEILTVIQMPNQPPRSAVRIVAKNSIV